MNFGEKIWILDGGMGSTILEHHQLSHDNCTPNSCLAIESLSESNPDFIADIHRSFLDTGADIICTNTFNINQLAPTHDNLTIANSACKASASIARKIADDYMLSHPDRKVYVAGSIGPVSPSAEQADDCMMLHIQQVRTLLDCNVDILLLETVIDIVWADAVLDKIFEEIKAIQKPVSVMLSVHIDNQGQTVMKQSREEIKALARKYPIAAFGLNCGNGAASLVDEIGYYDDLPCALMVYPNAGLPDSDGKYPDSPEAMAHTLSPLIAEGRINIVGGCCGSTPGHIKAISKSALNCSPRIIPLDNN